MLCLRVLLLWEEKERDSKSECIFTAQGRWWAICGAYLWMGHLSPSNLCARENFDIHVLRPLFILSRGEYTDLSPAQITFYVVSKPHTHAHSPSSILVSGSCARSGYQVHWGRRVCVILAALLCNFQRDGAINETRKQVYEHNRAIIKARIERTSTTPVVLLLMRAIVMAKKNCIDRLFDYVRVLMKGLRDICGYFCWGQK